MILHDKIAAQLPDRRERVKKLIKDHGDVVVSEVSVRNVYGGLRGVNALLSEISYVDPVDGIHMRGYSIAELLEKLPSAPGNEIPLAGGLYHLLLTGDDPTLEDAMQVEEEWKKRNELPDYLVNMLKSLPQNTHPMTMFSQAILMLQNESEFVKRYNAGMKKVDYWEATLEDSLNLTAKLPGIGSLIYNLKYRDGEYVKADPNLDWSGNFAYMIGKGDSKEYQELSRLFFIIHADQGAGNVSAHTTHLVGSALSDIYYSTSAGMNGLAGPLHGLANQECLRWLLDLRKMYGGLPSREELEKFAWDTLNSGQVIPGYGHAVLRHTDPRFTAQMEFGKKYMADDELFKLVMMVYDVVPKVLQELGKVKNPWPNVDAISGTLQYHYGVNEFDFYTVLFGVSRILGLTANAVWVRGLGHPIERPKSLTLKMLEDMVADK